MLNFTFVTLGSGTGMKLAKGIKAAPRLFTPTLPAQKPDSA
jgi:hypothetical protein